GKGLLARLPADGHWYEYLRENWKETLGASTESWEKAVQRGAVANPTRGASARAFRGDALARLPGRKAASGQARVLYEKVSMRDGRHANNAWLQELPDP